MSVDSKRMLKLENKVKELEGYINKIVGVVRLDSNTKIQALQKSVNEIKVYNKAKAVESDLQAKELKKEFKSGLSTALKAVDKSIHDFNLLVQNSKSETDKQIVYNNKSNGDAIQNFTEKLSQLIDSQEKRLLIKLAPPVIEVKEAAKIDMNAEVKAIVTKDYINSLVTKQHPQPIDFNKEIKSVVTAKYINNLVVKQDIPVVDVKGQVKSIVTKTYVNDLVVKQAIPVIDFKNKIESLVTKDYINKLVVKDKAQVIDVKSIITKEYINGMITKEKPQVIDIKSEIESVVNKQYINAIYRNK
jgi:hypothetical protein